MIEQQPPPIRDDALRKAVVGRIGAIQARRIDGLRHPDIDARLARLRRAVLAEAGTIPEVWEDTVGCLPDGLRFGEKPSQWEYAVHDAMTLYALHQQSKDAPVHKYGVRLGTAVQKLVPAADRDKPNPLRTRFQALSLAQTRTGVTHHLRSLISLLRSAGEPLDYGELAVDLRQLQDPLRAPMVRLRWGRAFSRVSNADPDASPEHSLATSSTTEN
ncbi:type I-E CRISPR-associated protein Cse2/CasB [Rhodococcus sp. 1168]|uniref:type I-E CRISPR-associated protein Cse2/CasB n=1 Tax=Rhodococcus sp. 1168 TaxID=2018041 RepID=UPI000A0AC3F2|nr:type I-E CRISPR-associated protein Cse2/CasB [Rhodococcus sp. 1168]ORI24089.1 type I-E CRISPR-associated protein Cse2/CasB [Rhodococcus sp. 1168]